MFRFLRTKRRFGVDAIFAIILALTYWGFHSGLSAISSDVNTLFLATYLFLGLGVLVLYLVSDMNPEFASIVHVGLFPFFSLIFIFAKWMPDVIPELNGIEMSFSLAMLAYTLLMIVFFTVQLLIHQSEPEPQEVRRMKGVIR
ncbi:hypothetical protein AKJ47_00055 [candidate division MSBL1 archaeon SCGC-AAA261G05]|uniref:Uncharacterized protein n=3 Tax=candidate division MSBL1 TaxID=215777 RepID=A0A133UZD1_9EURY|nr:hypothetical protein AKJ42_02980 [candidate division MSBL1 archaeon SCGC-AAA261C02]KXB04237.1 hypothetical protein AKJ47_00055 [candidate division MSBL1 archaeon SCGC-AAA261G05]KXB05101.1 hypothetical protein AKJ48_00080 [candidate division MSBL1 archaeon SCGC-AAA261O19]